MNLAILAICALALVQSGQTDDFECKDHSNCQMFPSKKICDTDEWVQLNCPKKCGYCGSSDQTASVANPIADVNQAAPTTAPDTAINAPYRNYTYPKPNEPSTATIQSSPLETAAYSAPAPDPAPAYTAPAPAPVAEPAYPAPAAAPTVAPTTAAPAPTAAAYPPAVPASPTQAAAYPPAIPASPTQAAAYPPAIPVSPTQAEANPAAAAAATQGYVNPSAAQPVYSSNAAQPEAPNWIVKMPPKYEESMQKRNETIRISFVKHHKPAQQVYGSPEVQLKPEVNNGVETMKISFMEDKPSDSVPVLPSPVGNQENVRVSLRGPDYENMKQYYPIKGPQNETGPYSGTPSENVHVSFLGQQNETFTNMVPPPKDIRNISVAFTGRENETVSVPLINTTAALPAKNISVNFDGHHDYSMPLGQGGKDIVQQIMNTQSPSNRNISISFREKENGPQITVEPSSEGTYPWDYSPPSSTSPLCQDHPGCTQYSETECDQEWMQTNCPATCSMCGNEFGDQSSTQTLKQLSVNVPQELTSSLETSREPVVVKIATEGGVAEISKDNNGPILEHIEVHLPSKIVHQKGNEFMFSDENHYTTNIQSSGQIPEAAWCRDDEKCHEYSTKQCSEPWLTNNCPKMCRLCRPICQDKSSDCGRYAIDSCDNDWMKENCQKSCAQCEGLEDQEQDTSKMAPNTDNVALSAQVGSANETSQQDATPSQCFYDGLEHKHGDRWSPGPCTPECRCHNGKIHCTVIECPKLQCLHPIKKRWKCCPECPPNEGVNSKCIKTIGGNGGGSCCVFPFEYKDKEYNKCISDDYVSPWCAVSSNFDIDGVWGKCEGNTELPQSDEIQEPDEKEKTIKVSFLGDSFSDQASHGSHLPSTSLMTGIYSSWNGWSKCTASCGGGTQERTRKCLNPTNALGGSTCDALGPGLESKECNTRPCPINGAFGNWSEWSTCDVTCGGGIQQRYRTCTNPPPSHGGRDCLSENLGPSMVSQSCNIQECPIDGMYTDWSGWSECSKSCGGGTRTRLRLCTNPPPGPGGRNCSWYGRDKEEEACNIENCEVDGAYSAWSKWTECSRTCGPGVITRHRMCDSPMPSSGGKDCSNNGPSFEQKPCEVIQCPAFGNWTNWSTWSTCTRSCGGGVQFRSRQCDAPGGIQYCLGERVESSLCKSEHCPVDGGYTKFSDWTPCSTTCGVGLKSRKRTCTEPKAQYGGKTCEDQGFGLPVEHEHCYNRQCPIHGEYTPWSEWSACSQKCGYGNRTRTRSCSNPAPASGGLDCTRHGEANQIVQCYSAECPQHGNYTSWSTWSHCSATCGEGTQIRSRSCANPEPAHGGNDCSTLGANTEAKACKLHDCPIDGQYTPWTSWSICSKSCGSGIKKRTRSCSDPSPFHGGKNCTLLGLGPNEEVERCFERPCPLNGGFNTWSAWSACSSSCGGGVMFRYRNCTSPEAMHGGKDCSDLGPSTESASCQMMDCPVNGNYGVWSAWSDCDRTCGGGNRIRSRSCTNPPPQFGGMDCYNLGPSNQAEICNMNKCPVHGNYSNWSLWSPCSVTCGVGTVERRRYCTNPPPSLGGRSCAEEGPETEKKSCELVECTATCKCGPWAEWTGCTATCGGGFQQRRRECIHPKNNKLSCDSDSKETRLCMPEPCPIHGKYTLWSPWTPCSATCGIGMKNRTRTCDAPVPQFGGQSCAEQEMGPALEVSKCYLMPCPENGGYTEWSDWTRCSATCGKGYRERKRYCSNPAPAYGGVDCRRLGSDKEKVDCFIADCPVNGKYTKWSDWSACSQSCGYGIQSRYRTCSDPEPMHGGRDCTEQGDPESIRPCQNIQCPIHGKYSSWSSWGVCSKSCGDGIKRRTRQCNHPGPEYGGMTCQDQNLGPNIEEAKCSLQDCAVDGSWSGWSDWSKCSTACGPGQRIRKRECSKPPPSNGGKKCAGASEQVGDCTAQPCPVNGNYTAWTDWSECDKSCGTGIMTRWRACALPLPQNGGLSCSYMGPDTETKLCMNSVCRTNGNWGEWSIWSKCSKSCGDGVRTRERQCDNPAPSGGGSGCAGDTTQNEYCKARDCCPVVFKPVGCYRDNRAMFSRPLPELLIAKSPSSNTIYHDSPSNSISWNSDLPEIVCNCAMAANDKGYSHFGLQDYSSCYSGPRAGMTFNKDGIQGAFIQSPAPKPWLGCITTDLAQCDDSTKYCSGQQNSNFVYTFYNITPVNGGYSEWSAWTGCSSTCGTGFKSRTRNCTNPKPEYGGQNCYNLGDPIETALCDTNVRCPVDGGFSEWGEWSKCSSKCGKGSRTRERSCTSPIPSWDGKPCVGPTNQSLPCNAGDCPVNGTWSGWSSWRPCSATCGDGIHVRTRDCSHPKPSNGGFSCEGDSKEQKPCSVKRCPVNGNYTSWSEWSDCSRTCGGGSQFRTRDCINPSPMYGGRDCAYYGARREVTHCNPQSCPVDGNWGAWKMWSFCSSTCGPGKRERMRLCDNPAPKFGGKGCPGSSRETMPCSLSDCPVDGGWGDWGNWTACSTTCGVSKRSRTRECNNPPPAHGGKSCIGAEKEEAYCENTPCMINGGYTEWGSWTQCDVTCGGGRRQRSRACTNPVPEFGGHDCSADGAEVQEDACNTRPCARNGEWSGWSLWSPCSRSCGNGVEKRIRTCTSPTPSYGGSDCVGKSEEIKACKIRDCCDISYRDLGCFRDDHNMYRPLPKLLFSDNEEKRVDMQNWESYLSDVICRCARAVSEKGMTTFAIQNYGDCYSGEQAAATYYQEGEQLVFGDRSQPKPWLGCIDNNKQECHSNNLECGGQERSNYVYTIENVQAMQGNYTAWSPWSKCSKDCGVGERYRTRNCTNPPPAWGGLDCRFEGKDREEESCKLQDCPIDANWGTWSAWSKCTASCGRGIVRRSRRCDSPKPSNGGKPCPGYAHETAECKMTPCPINGNFSEWSAWSTCSVTCGNGRQVRARKCNSPTPAYGGRFCDGVDKEYQNCEEDICPGYFSDWSSWTVCSTSCGNGGLRERYRTCQGGPSCYGSAREVERCKSQPCPHCSNAIDLAFLLDASGTIDDSQWKLTKDFVKGVVNAFHVANNGTRTSIITYSTLPHVEKSFHEMNDKVEIKSYLDSMTQPRGETRTDRALKMARDQILSDDSGSRAAIPKAVIVVTDGGSRNKNKMAIQRRAHDLKDMDGATVVVLGVGDNVDRQVIRQVVSDPEHAYLVAAYDDLPQYVKLAADAVCQAKPPPPPPRWGAWTDWSPCMKTCGDGVSVRSRRCLTGANCRGPYSQKRHCKIQDCPSCQSPTDLAFAIPISSNIKDTEWRDVQNFMKGTANAFNVSYDGTHVGLVSYSNMATLELKFNRYFYQQDVFSTLDNMFPEASSEDGTRLDDAMMVANYELFTPASGSRKNVAKSLIVLSNGELGSQNMGDVTQHLRKNNIKTVVVTINEDDADQRLADSVADDLHHTLHVKSFKDLIGIIEKTVNLACHTPTREIIPPKPVAKAPLSPPPKADYWKKIYGKMSYPRPKVVSVTELPAQQHNDHLTHETLSPTYVPKQFSEQYNNHPRQRPVTTITTPKQNPATSGYRNPVATATAANQNLVASANQNAAVLANNNQATSAYNNQRTSAMYPTNVAATQGAPETQPQTTPTTQKQTTQTQAPQTTQQQGPQVPDIPQLAQNQQQSQSQQPSSQDQQVSQDKQTSVTPPQIPQLEQPQETQQQTQTQATQTPVTAAHATESQSHLVWKTIENAKASQSANVAPQTEQTQSASKRYVCPHNMDIVVALDSSADVSPLQWAHQKQFVRNILESFNMSEDSSHVGVVAYSTIPSIQSKLDERNNHDDVIKSIQTLPRDVSNRNLVILLEMAKFEMFTSSGGMRQHVPKVLLVNVMGTQKDHNTNAAKSLKAFSKQLQYSGVQVVAVGNEDVPEEDLKNMATKKNFAMRVNSLQKPEEAAKVAKVMCHVGSLNSFTLPYGLQRDKPAPAPVQMPAAPAPAVPASTAEATSNPEPAKPLQDEPMKALQPSPEQLAAQIKRSEYPFRCQPVLYFNFDKQCASTIYDESGMGNNGRLQGKLLPEGGVNGNIGLDLSEAFIQLDGRNFKGKPSSAVTIAAWINVKDLTEKNVHEIFVAEANASPKDNIMKPQYRFEILDQGKIRFFQRNFNKTVYGKTTKQVIEPNRWIHIAGSYNPGSREATIFVNGQRVTDYEKTDEQETDALSTEWGDVVQIGSHYLADNKLRKFKGALDEFYIFPCSLDTEDVRTIMKTREIPATLAPYQGVKRMVWRNVTGKTITELALNKDYPDNPTEVGIIPSFKAPEDDGNDYGSRISGYFVPQYTGDYSFTLTGDDEAELFFSDDASPRDKNLLAAVKSSEKKASYQKTQILPLEAGKYYWIEALHKQGKSRDMLKVGYNLECPSEHHPLMTQSSIPLQSLHYKLPRSCAEIQKTWSGYHDDEYAIQLSPTCEPVRLYCHGMRTKAPKEYITLHAGPDKNYARFERSRLLNYETCGGKANPYPKLTEKYWGISRFYKVRVNPENGLLQRDDFTFADTLGNPVRYGRAGDCYSASKRCHRGRFQIDLTGTGLRLHNDAEWEPWGSPKIPQRMLNYRKSPGGTLAYGECGGSCGGCQPKNARLHVEPQRCLGALNQAPVFRHAIPKKGSTKSSIPKIHLSKTHEKTYFRSPPGLDESEMEVIGHIARKRRHNIDEPMRNKIRKLKRRLSKGY